MRLARLTQILQQQPRKFLLLLRPPMCLLRLPKILHKQPRILSVLLLLLLRTSLPPPPPLPSSSLLPLPLPFGSNRSFFFFLALACSPRALLLLLLLLRPQLPHVSRIGGAQEHLAAFEQRIVEDLLTGERVRGGGVVVVG
jgi:hypothetical protein